MGNTQKPTIRTWHIDIKYFALCKLVERNHIRLERIDTLINIADHLTKFLSHIFSISTQVTSLDMFLLNIHLYINTPSLHTAIGFPT